MFHPLSSLFRRTHLGWEETDVKHFIEQYFQNRVKTDALYCEKVNNGVAVVRVGSPTTQQEVTLLEFDLMRDLYQRTNYKLKQLIVYNS